jgi:hypothetical protein
MKSGGTPLDPTQRLKNAPKCSATAKSTGKRCRCPSKHGWNVCRLHGAGGGAPPDKAQPNYRHGLRTKDMNELRKLISQFNKSPG